MYGNTFSLFWSVSWIVSWIGFWHFVSKRNKLVIWENFEQLNAKLDQYEQNININILQMSFFVGKFC